jgi:hypothetical protein
MKNTLLILFLNTILSGCNPIIYKMDLIKLLIKILHLPANTNPLKNINGSTFLDIQKDVGDLNRRLITL